MARKDAPHSPQPRADIRYGTAEDELHARWHGFDTLQPPGEDAA